MKLNSEAVPAGGGAAGQDMGEFLLNSNNWAQREGKGIEERKEEGSS